MRKSFILSFILVVLAINCKGQLSLSQLDAICRYNEEQMKEYLKDNGYSFMGAEKMPEFGNTVAHLWSFEKNGEVQYGLGYMVSKNNRLVITFTTLDITFMDKVNRAAKSSGYTFEKKVEKVSETMYVYNKKDYYMNVKTYVSHGKKVNIATIGKREDIEALSDSYKKLNKK